MLKVKRINRILNVQSGLCLGLLLLFTAGSNTSRIVKQDEFSIPDVMKTGENGVILQELIYPLDNTPTPQCHASTIEETSTGLIAAWFGGTHERNPDVGIWVSRNDGAGWSGPIEVANGIQSDTLRYPCWNPVLFQPASGGLMLFYKVGPSPREWWGMVVTSEDEGKTWSGPRKLGEGPNGDLIGPVKNKPVQLEDGTIISPSSRETDVPGGRDIWNVHFEISRDNGSTWETVGPIHDGQEIQAIQPSILFYEDGRMQILCRTQQNRISESWSEDGGSTWSPMQLTSLPNPSSGTDAVTLKDGKQLLIYNHTSRRGEFPSGRNMLNLAVSEDGKNWKPVLTLERQEGEYSYPAIIQTEDGLVHMTYTYRRVSVKRVVIDPGQLL
jgi:predicted neuraminidase